MRHVVSDLLIWTGAAAVTYGCYEIYEPAGYICGGLFAITIGALMAVNIARKSGK